MPIKPTDGHVLSTVLNSSFMIGFSPFKVKHAKDGSVYIQRSSIQKIICICLVIGTTLVRITEVRSRVPGSMIEWNPLFYFQLFCGLINIVFNCAVSKILLYESDKFFNIIGFIQHHSITIPQSQNYLQRVMKWICICEMLLGILVSFMDILPFVSFSLENFSQFIKCTVVEGKYTFFLESSITCTGSDSSNIVSTGKQTVTDCCIAILYCILKMFRHIHGYYGELLLLSGVITLWLPAASFHTIVKNEYNPQMNNNIPLVAKFESLHEKYTTLKQFSKLVNEAFGLMLLWFIIASIFYYSSNLDVLVITNNPIIKIRVISFYLSALITFLLAADISHRVKAFDDWISDLPIAEVKMIPQNSLAIIVHELTIHKIGMSGNNIFTVTYAFMANMVGVLMTYFVVCVQFREPWVVSKLS